MTPISDNEIELSIALLSTFCININEYEVEADEAGGSKYIYEDIYMNAKVIYYPEKEHAIEIVFGADTIACVNVDKADFLLAQEEYIEEQLSNFTEDWYKENKYYWSIISEDGFAFDYIELEDDIEIFLLNALEFNNKEYEIDYENFGYIYEFTSADGNIYLVYYPSDCSIELRYSDGESNFYNLISEEDYLAKIELQEEYNNSLDNSNNNTVTYSDAEIYQAAYRFIGEALQDTTYSNYYWEYVRDSGISSYIGGGYTATLYMYSEELHSYKYLRVNMGVGPQGLYFISGGM